MSEVLNDGPEQMNQSGGLLLPHPYDMVHSIIMSFSHKNTILASLGAQIFKKHMTHILYRNI